MWSKSEGRKLRHLLHLALLTLAVLSTPQDLAYSADNIASNGSKPQDTLFGHRILYVPSDHISKGSALLGHRVIAEITAMRGMRLGAELGERFRISTNGYGLEAKVKLFNYGIIRSAIGYESNTTIDGYLSDPDRVNQIKNAYLVMSWGRTGKYLTMGLDYLKRSDDTYIAKPFVGFDYQVYSAENRSDFIQLISLVSELRGYHRNTTGTQSFPISSTDNALVSPSVALGTRLIGGNARDISIMEIGIVAVPATTGYLGGAYLGFSGLWVWRLFDVLAQIGAYRR